MAKQFYVATLNARLRPMDRGEIFEDPLQEELERLKMGGLAGGGTGLSSEGEPMYSDIEIESEHPDALATIIRVLEALGAPIGSKITVDGETTPFGKTEGLALYLNGADLPDEVYQTSDVNFVYDELNRLCEGVGAIFSYWQGPRDTALYLYGESFAILKEKIAPLLESYPLCQKCRVEQIA